MKVIEIIPDLTLGGAERFVTDISNCISNDNTDVILVTFFNTKKSRNFNNLLNPKIKKICYNKKVGFSFTLIFKLWILIFRERPNVVHTHLNCIIYTILCWLTLRKVKFIHTIHNDANMECGGKLGLAIRKLAFSGFVIPVTISKESKKTFQKLYKKNSNLIYNGRCLEKISNEMQIQINNEINTLKSQPSNISIVNLARFADQKNQIELVKAVNEINKEKERIDLFLIGSNDFNDRAKVIHKKILEISNKNIHIMNERENSQFYLNSCDAFCLSSIYEGMPISILESFANACPVLSTPVGGIVEMVETGKNGILSKDTSKDEIKNMLLQFCNLNETQRMYMKQQSLLSYKKYSMKYCVDQYYSLFKKST